MHGHAGLIKGYSGTDNEVWGLGLWFKGMNWKVKWTWWSRSIGVGNGKHN